VHTPGLVGTVAILMARRLQKPTTLFLHNDYRKLITFAVPWAPRLADIGALVERWAAKAASRVITAGEPEGRLNAHRLIVRAPYYPYPATAPGCEDVVTVSYHGRVSREKALDVTIRALAEVDKRQQRYELMLVGGGSLLSEVLVLAESLEVRVRNIKWCEEPRAHLSASHIYVTASREETFSISTLEALGCGLPVIARAVGCIPSYIEHGRNGLLFEKDEELPGLIALLAADPSLRARIAAGALSSTVRTSIWDQFADASVLVHD